jgi:hypothetical protein
VTYSEVDLFTYFDTHTLYFSCCSWVVGEVYRYWGLIGAIDLYYWFVMVDMGFVWLWDFCWYVELQYRFSLL